MTAPAVAAARFCMSAGVGAILGLFYDFLRPLRQKHNALPDLIFVLAAFAGWVYVGFGICLGDLGLPWFFAMGLGGFLWEVTLGRLLRPVFGGFWKGFRLFFHILLVPLQKIFGFSKNFTKKVFAKWKKWVTIGWNICRHRRRRRKGGDHHAEKKTPLSFGIHPDQPFGQGCDFGGDRPVHHRNGRTPRQHRRKQRPV